MTKTYAGVIIPMVTPFTKEGKIDVEATKRICNYFVNNGVSPLLLGTTGESTSVPAKDGKLFVKTAVEAINNRVTVYANLSGNCVQENIESAKAYLDYGTDVIVSILPCYYPLTPQQMIDYYLTLADSLNAPVMVYNIPATTNMSIPVEVVQELSKHPNIFGFKDSERDELRMEKCVNIFAGREDFSYFTGFAKLSASSLRKGADGIIPSTGNFIPKMFKQLYDYALQGNWDEAERLQFETGEIAKIYQEGRTLGQSLPALKTMMSVLGLCEPYSILPLTTPSLEEQKNIIGETKKMIEKYSI